MATLVSPGVSVSIIDETLGQSSPEGTVPFVVVATGQDKTTPDGSSYAVGTTKANANKLVLVTSQRELLQTFGSPTFRSVGGNQIHGDPTNEYGLLAAHSYLGLANGCFVVRADVDLEELQPSVVMPTSPAANGTMWISTTDSAFGVFQYNIALQTWESKAVNYTFEGDPSNAVGAIGDFAVSSDDLVSTISYWIKDLTDTWVLLETLSTSGGAYGGITGGSADCQFGKVWPITNSSGGPLVGGEYWIKTVASNNGANFVIRVYNADTRQYELKSSPFYGSDSAASAAYGVTLAVGSLYLRPSTQESVLSLRRYNGSAWVDYSDYYFTEVPPTRGPLDGTLWYNPDLGLNADGDSTVDLLVNSGTGSWLNVKLPGFDYDANTGAATGSRTAFYNAGAGEVRLIMQSDDPVDTGFSLINGDIWVETDAVKTYPVIRKWKASTNSWILVDNADQTTNHGIIFADARPDPYHFTGVYIGQNNGGGSNPDLDIDVPDPDAYPGGTMLWNTRFSSRNVKKYDANHLVNFDGTTPFYTGRWVSESGNDFDGSPLMGENAVRAVVAKAIASVLVSNEEIRSEALFYNLIAAPGYPEVIDEMVMLNVDRKETAFVLGDSPMKLKANSTDLLTWCSNKNIVPSNGSKGLVTSDPYLGVYYPSGLATNVDGSEVVVPPSHMTLRQFGYNDNVAYPWFAPAGQQRGRITNAVSVGYVDDEGEYVSVSLNGGQRDTLYTNNVNPISVEPNQGPTIMGQRTRNPYYSAMSGVNVARLMNYIRWNADIIAKPFLFEPNDKVTRDNAIAAFTKFLAELVTLRGIYDFIVVCDTTNNYPARIDRNELWIDILVAPVRAVEFIYVPIRIRSTGSL